ncbi:hypothetical protein C8F01DRAFT_1128264 [Mycena amicta]|nr:hypothetical protein C8F01DRAFT_1128264 [Mycena amicta]
MGVTTFLDTAVTWLDCNGGPFDFKDLFARLAIARSLQQGNTSFQSSMVMEVDLKNWTFDTESDMESRRHSLEEFLIGRVRAFAKKYERIVGLLRDLGRTASLAQWMGHILVQWDAVPPLPDRWPYTLGDVADKYRDSPGNERRFWYHPRRTTEFIFSVLPGARARRQGGSKPQC